MFSDASGTPFSAIVGTSGNADTRFGAEVASGIRSPDLIRGANELRPLEAIVTWPPMMAFFTGPPPWNGTCVMSSPYEALNSSTMKNDTRSEEHTSELQSPCNLVCRLLLEKKKNI